MSKGEKLKPTPMRFSSMSKSDVPTGRNGKHKEIVTQLLSDIEQLEAGKALKVPLAELPDTKENIRSALNRATRGKGMNVATSSDETYSHVPMRGASAIPSPTRPSHSAARGARTHRGNRRPDKAAYLRPKAVRRRRYRELKFTSKTRGLMRTMHGKALQKWGCGRPAG